MLYKLDLEAKVSIIVIGIYNINARYNQNLKFNMNHLTGYSVSIKVWTILDNNQLVYNLLLSL